MKLLLQNKTLVGLARYEFIEIYILSVALYLITITHKSAGYDSLSAIKRRAFFCLNAEIFIKLIT